MILKLLIVLLLISLVAIVVHSASAEQQANVKLPFDRPYVDTHCQTFFAITSDETKSRVVVNCYWVWEFGSDIIDDVKKLIPGSLTVPNSDLPPAVIDLINKNPPPKPDENPTQPADTGAGIDDRIDTYKEQVNAVAKLAECFRGYDASHEWGAFVDTQIIPYWMNSTREQYAERDGLSARQLDVTPELRIPLLGVLKAIEECNAIKRYVFLGMIGSEEAVKAVHDHLNIGKNNSPVPLPRGSEGKTPLNTPDALNQKLLDEAQRAREFSCSPANEARKLCAGTFGFYGINRGISQPIISKDAFVNAPLSPNDGKTAVDVYSAYKMAKAERDLSLTDTAKYLSEINQITCDKYFIHYKHQLGTNHFPEWLNTACMAGTKATQYDLAKRLANE